MYGVGLPSFMNWLLIRMACRFCAQVNWAWIFTFFPSGESGSVASHSCAVRNAIGASGDDVVGAGLWLWSRSVVAKKAAITKSSLEISVRFIERILAADVAK